MSSEELTTAQVAERFDESPRLIRLWCQQGRFPHARTVETPRGPVWLIPVRDLTTFIKPKPGPVPKAQPSGSPSAANKRATGSATARNGALKSKAKKKGGKK